LLEHFWLLVTGYWLLVATFPRVDPNNYSGAVFPAAKFISPLYIKSGIKYAIPFYLQLPALNGSY